MLSKQISLDTDQLSEFQQWRKANGDDFSMWDYLFGVANVEVAIAFTSLFWPDIVEHEDGIFLAESFEAQIYQQWKGKFGNDIASIERVINHQHLDDILPGADKVGSENLFYLGRAIAQMWASRLESLYPNRRFEVCCDRDESTVVVTFYQVPV
jgi:hypothetical protein